MIDALWAQCEPVVYITRDQFVRGLADWDVEAVRIDGELAFVAVTQGPELHYTRTGAEPLTLSRIRGWMNAVIDRYGYVTTRTPKDDLRQCRLVARLGARPVGEDEFWMHYRLDRACPSSS